MNINHFSDDDSRLFAEIFAGDNNSEHIFWDFQNGSSVRLSGSLVPDGETDPLAYIADSGAVEESFVPAFDLFRRRIAGETEHYSGENRLSVDVSLKTKDSGAYRLCHIGVMFGIGSTGGVKCAYINITPYSEKEISDKRILDIFTSDKAPYIFSGRIKKLMQKYSDRGIAFVQFDVERFKLINENYGAEMGDEVLKYLKDSLAVMCSDEQPFARLSADLFMIVIVFDEEQEIIDFIHKVENTIGGRYKDIEFRLTFGVAIAEDRTLHTRTHGDNATLARQSIKGNALSNIGFYNGSLKMALYRQSNIEEDMASAMLNNEFVMYLQPKYSISTGKIIGAEALARWIHPNKGLIPPNEFVPVFEKNGFIVKLDQLMWESACRKIREWIDNGIKPVPISVNISRKYLNSFDVVGKFRELIEKYNIPVNLLEAEITESYDAQDTSGVVMSMKECGFTMLMDDFGSGFSSLNMLKTTPFDILKIDREFLSEFMESERGRKIIAHTISMSRDIGLDIIAEGVETNAQAQFLSGCGCDTAQGFYYSKPIPADEFDKHLYCGN